MLARPRKSCNQTPRHSSTKIIYYRQGTLKVRKYHKVNHWNPRIQHGDSSQDHFSKKRKERIIEINPMKTFRNYQDKKGYSSGLENIRIYRQTFDQDYKIVKINLEKQEINFAKQFST